MAGNRMLQRLKIRLGLEDSSLPLLEDFLEDAEKEVIKKRFPYGGYSEKQKEKALDDYSHIVKNIVVYLWNKQGAEGETSHSENGISRSYESAGIPDSYTADIVPMCGTF